MKKTNTIGFCTFLSLIAVRAYAQDSSSHYTAMDPVIIAGIELIVVLGVLYFLIPKKPKEEPIEKKKNYVGLVIFGFVLLAMMVTNPSLEDHRQAVTDELGKKISQSTSGDQESDSWEKIGAQIGESIGKIVLDRVVKRENYLLFSITTVKVGDVKKDLGFGVFGKVWLYHNLN